MGGRRTKLTPEVQATIAAAIRAGAWDYVAARAAGIDQSTFRRWLIDPRKRAFCAAVEEAHAQARMAAEIEVRKVNPLAWLKQGPGRDREGAPGWADHVEHTGEGGGPVAFTLAALDEILEGAD